jgi:hypothetical protein
VAEKLITLDPLNEDAALILARAYREAKQNQKALQTLTKNEALPIKVKDLELRAANGKATVKGTAVGNKAAAGSPVTLRFTFFGESGPVGTQTVTVNAPAAEATTPFTVSLDTQAPVVGYSYQLGQ